MKMISIMVTTRRIRIGMSISRVIIKKIMQNNIKKSGRSEKTNKSNAFRNISDILLS